VQGEGTDGAVEGRKQVPEASISAGGRTDGVMEGRKQVPEATSVEGARGLKTISDRSSREEPGAGKEGSLRSSVREPSPTTEGVGTTEG